MRLIILFFLLITSSVLAQNTSVLMTTGGNRRVTPEPPNPATGIWVDQSFSGTSDGTAAAPWKTIQDAASVAPTSETVWIKSGTYRETVTPTNNGVTFRAAEAGVVISGADVISDAGWTVHSGNIWKKTQTLGISGGNFNEYSGTSEGGFFQGNSNTQLLANQIWKDGDMQHLARWPNISTTEDQFDKTKLRGRSQTSSFTASSINDAPLGTFGGLTGAQVWINGWFVSQTRLITSQSGNQINFPAVTTSPIEKFGKFYYVTNKLGLLDAEKEWFYDGTTLYYRQPGGGSPTGLEFKKRNWGFNLRDKDNTFIIGIDFFGCDPVTTTTASDGNTLHSANALYMNHSFINSAQGPAGDARTATMTGTKMIGTGNLVTNSTFKYSGAQGIWLGTNSKAENNVLSYIGYDGMWSSAFNLWFATGGQTITRNTTSYTSRGAVELGTPPHINHLNVEISYNDFSQYNKISIDGGAVYAGAQSNLTGTVVHHNWFHDNGVQALQTPLDGTQINGTYYDQASGPTTVHHNVVYNGGPEQYSSDYYAEIANEHRNSGGHKLYNNTLAGAPNYGSYVTYVTSVADVQRNQIFRDNVNIAHGAGAGNIANSLFQGTNPLFVGGGGGGLAYRLQAGSPARGIGVAIPGITTGSPVDAGAYSYGDPNPWVPGATITGYTP